ncbi:MAG TPA: cytochrome b/b6 domain-containing protein [Pyrinomonadaceae bacterium]|nr:cytochrome b/b6 domain-containing protein [Pyrinomonadaceae bacterium]
MAKRLETKHLLATRWFHWVNFPLLLMMVWSGILIYWANPVYGFKIFGYELFHFFPAWFYESLGVPYRLAQGIAFHFFFMWFFVVNGVLYVAYTILSGEWRSLVPLPGSFKRAFYVTLHDIGLRKQATPQGKYNDGQRIAYTSVVLFGVGSVITGFAIYKPTQLWWLTAALGGYEWARWEHFVLMVLYVLFFIVHFGQVLRAGWSNFRSMVTGRDVVDVPDIKPEEAKI